MDDLEMRSLEGLDWPVLLETLGECARTSLGASAIAALRPLEDVGEVEAAFDAVSELMTLEDSGTNLPIGGVGDIRDELDRAARGQVLEPVDLQAVAATLEALRRLEEVCDAIADDAPTLAGIGSGIVVDDHVAAQLRHAFDDAGRLSGETYPQISTLRGHIASLHEEVRGTLDGLVKGDELGDVLQDRFWTVRENRYVLPIKAHAKRWDLGIVHDTSGSGRTVFVEPREVVILNNRLRVAEGQLRAEERRILAELSRMVGVAAEGLMPALEVATELDIAAARATLARRLEAHRPHVGRSGVIRLHAARHPVLVLRGIEVVANDLLLDASRPVLVISGPNAGGKTIALKTVGLCAALVRHGCFVPAGDESRVDLFDTIDAVIGDQQTVHGDLSSFSAHLLVLSQLVQIAGPGVLLLLDELASGTDPAQGAALAGALLERFADVGARVVVTTHYAPLKARAAVDERFAVAAMQYVEGRPTYRVLPDSTGESHAFGIALSMGLPVDLVDRGRALLGDGERRLSETLEALEDERARAVAAADRAVMLERELADQQREVERREERIRVRAKALEAAGAEAFLNKLKQAEKAVASVVAELQRAPDHRRARAARSTIQALRQVAGTGEVAVEPAVPVLEVGDRVRIRSLGQVGEVLGWKGSQVRVRARAGMLLHAKPTDLERLGGPAPAASRGRHQVTRRASSSPVGGGLRLPTNTLDLRGKRVEESQELAEAFFDEAVLAGQGTVFLLHGHGTGALKSGLRSWLRGNRYVRRSTPASADQGGDAFTVVELVER